MQRGFTLVEVVFSLFVLTVFIVAILKTSTFTKYSAEQNLYESTALNAAIGIIEQIKGANYELLINPELDSDTDEIFTASSSTGSALQLKLAQANTISVPIITESGGDTAKTLAVSITPTLTETSKKVKNLVNTQTPAGIWVEVEYAWAHPRTGRTNTGVMRNMVSLVSTY